jgi:hypothetical protein
MRRELKYTLRLLEHLKAITLKYFDIKNTFISELDDVAAYRAYIRDIIVEQPFYADFTPEQRYLHDLAGVISPVLSAYRTKKRIPLLRPRTGKVTASAILEESGQRLAMDTFHFKERISLFGASTIALIVDLKWQKHTQMEIGRIIRNFSRETQRLLKYRNFVVHGPKTRTDEFADLRSWELGGIFLHDDLWLDYNNEFETTRAEWAAISKDLIRSMESTIAAAQLLNANNIERRAFTFSKLVGRH